MKSLSIGIDIGGTNSVFGLIDTQGVILASDQIQTKGHPIFSDYVAEFSRLIKSKLYEFPDYQLTGIGIGAPNGNYRTGTIDHAPNLPWKGKVNIVQEFHDSFKVPVFLTNDAKAAAIGEKIYGGAKDKTDFIVLTLGTGLGAGIYSSGKILYGSDGLAGEFGHLTSTQLDRECACGRTGCWETYVSATGIKRTVFDLLATQPIDSELRKYAFNALEAKIIAKYANEGDRVAQRAFEITGRMLGEAIADLYSMFSPEAVFLFGGLANAGDILFEPARKSAMENAMQIHKSKINIQPSQLDNEYAAVLGASAMTYEPA